MKILILVLAALILGLFVGTSIVESTEKRPIESYVDKDIKDSRTPLITRTR